MTLTCRFNAKICFFLRQFYCICVKGVRTQLQYTWKRKKIDLLVCAVPGKRAYRRRHIRIVDTYLYFPPGGLCPPGFFLSIGSHYQSIGASGLLVFSFPAWSRARYLFPGCYALIHVRSISVSVTSPDPSKLYPVRPFAEPRRSLHVQSILIQHLMRWPWHAKTGD